MSLENTELILGVSIDDDAFRPSFHVDPSTNDGQIDIKWIGSVYIEVDRNIWDILIRVRPITRNQGEAEGKQQDSRHGIIATFTPMAKVRKRIGQLLLIPLLLFSVTSYSQEQGNEKKRIKKQSKKNQQSGDKQTEEDAAYAKYSQELHMKNQSKKTRKMMKKAKKKAKRNNLHKREFFLVRLFKKRKKY